MPRHRGVVLIITMLALLLLAGLVLWVLNLGQQINHRIRTQNTADATAKAGAVWVARTLNTVSENNADMARYIGLINVLDAMPQAVDFTHRESDKMKQSLDATIARGITGPGPAKLDQLVLSYFQGMDADLTSQLGQIVPVDDFYKSLNVHQMTLYPDGSIWHALYALDELNQGLMQNLGDMAAISAVAGGRADRVNGDNGAFMAPLTPSVPYRRGQFNDFEQPVLDGHLPPQTDDRIVNRGPWDAVYGWRDVRYETTGGTYVPGTRQVSSGGNPGNPLSRGGGGGSNGRLVGATSTPLSYSTYGPQSWMLRTVGDYNYYHLYLTRLSMYESRIAHHKSDYLWPRGTQREVIDPDWRITFGEAEAIAQAGKPQIKETAYFTLEIKSKYPRTDARFLTPGTWALALNDPSSGGNRANGTNDVIDPRIDIRRGYLRLNDSKKICNDVWRYEWQYEVFFDSDIGITPQMQTVTNPDGTTSQQPLAQPVYRIDTFAFAGINVGPDASIDSPYAGFNPDDPSAPAPTDLDHTKISPTDADARFHYLTYLGIARQGDEPQAWSKRFRGGRPYPNMVAIAQAKVFNNHSWDLWTPMWHSELEPVSNYDQWVSRLSDGQVPDGVDAKDVDDLTRYLQASAPLAGVMLGH